MKYQKLILLVLFLFLFLFLLLSFLTLPRNPLQNDDASLYALAAKNAIIHNMWLAQFVTPGDLSSFMDKPPLGIWLLAWLPKIIGINQLTIHIPNVLYYCLVLALLYFALSRLASRRLAFYSTLTAATSLCLVVFSRSPKLDVLLTLFVLAANMSLYAFKKENKPKYLMLFTLALALGFLVKSGHGLIFPGLTALALFCFDGELRRRTIGFIFSRNFVFCLLLFLVIVGGVLWAQAIPLKEQWLPYLKSITIQSKYNTSYLGFGFHSSAIGFLLIAAFPWMAFICYRPHSSLTRFCHFWLWSNFFFLLFFYQQSDLRTFTVFVPPLAILAGERLASLQLWSRRRLAEVAWSLFYLFVFSAILIGMLVNPKNAQGFDLTNAIVPVAFFVLSLLLLAAYSFRPSRQLFTAGFLTICLSYAILFYNTLPLANAFNPDLNWPRTINAYRQKGYSFIIYRPPDRPLFYSPDLFWVDFMAGPADRYYWDRNELKHDLAGTKIILLSDLASFNKLNMNRAITIARDNYSALYQIN